VPGTSRSGVSFDDHRAPLHDQQEATVKTYAAPDAAPPVGPYSPAVAAGSFVFCSGQIALDAAGQLVGYTAPDQARKALDNLTSLLGQAGLDLSAVVKTTIFLTDLADFAAVNEVYADCFADPFPARSTVQVAALPKGAKVEIEAIAARR
jgi:2-iminobutanoate/2-iminopropanoate deaminase